MMRYGWMAGRTVSAVRGGSVARDGARPCVRTDNAESAGPAILGMRMVVAIQTGIGLELAGAAACAKAPEGERKRAV